MSMPDLQDQLAISVLMQRWALARDTGDWDALSATAHPGAAMTTTWFDGTFEAFVESCRASWAKGSRSQHFLGGTAADVEGDRAIAQTRMSINVRSRLDGVEVDAVCHGRFFDRVEKRDGAWRIAKRSVIYEKDRAFSGGLPPPRLPSSAQRRPGQFEPADRERRSPRAAPARGESMARERLTAFNQGDCCS